MSDQQPPSEEPNFAHYWAWVAREKVEEEVYRLIRTTPGLADRSNMVEDVEVATKQIVAKRKEHLMDLYDGWEIMEKTMNREIAIKLFNEFIAGSRTLEDFESLNFSKKHKDQQGKPRSSFQPHLSGNPCMLRSKIADLANSGTLPSTSMVYSSMIGEYYSEAATDKYYDLLFGDCKVFYDILQENNSVPNMPILVAIPMPYHPNMNHEKDFVKWHKVIAQYASFPQMQVPFLPPQPPPAGFQIALPPAFIPIQMSGPPMEGSAQQGPPMQGPPMQGFPMQGPPMQGPQMQGPPMQGSQIQGPPMQGPQMQGPQMQSPQMQGPQMQGPQMQNPQMQGPQMQGPQMQGPPMQGPPMQGITMQAIQMQRIPIHALQMQSMAMQGAQMQNIPMQAPHQENVYGGATYQRSQPNGYYGNGRHPGHQNQRSGNQNGYKGRNNRNERYGRYQSGYEYSEHAPSTSSTVAQRTEPVREVEEKAPAPPMVEEVTDESFPALDSQEPTTSLSVDVSAPETTSAPAESATAVLATPRKFSDVVSHTASAAASIVDASEGSLPATVDEVEDESSGNGSRISSDDTPSGTSDARSVTSESIATTSDPSASESTTADTPTIPAESTTSSTTALVVDTTDQPTPIAPLTSHRTVAEVVQQSLSATPSPTSKRVNGASSTQPSPAVKSNTAVPSPAVKAAHSPQTTPRESASREHTRSDNRRKSARSPMKPSVSYAEMLYPKIKGSSNSSKTKSATQSSSNQQQSSSSAATTTTQPTDWHTVKNKKAAEPAILSPPLHTPPLERKPAPKSEPVAPNDEEEDEVVSDDPEAEKKREKRRRMRQKLKEANRQQKQHEKEAARQESLARVELINGTTKKEKEDEKEKEKEIEMDGVKDGSEITTVPTAQPPAFDRNNLAARRKKRQELQRGKVENDSSTSNPSSTSSPSTIPVNRLPTGMGSNPMGASITAGQTAMAAYGVNSQYRLRSSPFSFISTDGSTTLPLFLPPQDGLRTTGDGMGAAVLLEESAPKTYTPVKLARNIDPRHPMHKKTEMDDNAMMIEKLLMFESSGLMKELDMSDSDYCVLAKGLDELKFMYTRVEQAGQLIAYKTGSSKVTEMMERRILQCAAKLLNTRSEIEPTQRKFIDDLGNKIATSSSGFNYTNYITALIDFSETRASELPKGSDLRNCYEQCVVLTRLYMKRTEFVYKSLSKHYDIANFTEDLNP